MGFYKKKKKERLHFTQHPVIVLVFQQPHELVRVVFQKKSARPRTTRAMRRAATKNAPHQKTQHYCYLEGEDGYDCDCDLLRDLLEMK